MSTPLPPDPYVALGLSKDATAAQVKTTYRKLVLRCHPDKVTDESKKAEASDQFHRIQQAYEILSDEGRRSRYDAQIKMAELRKQSMSSRPQADVRTAAYEVPASGPGRATFTARGSERVYEERRPERADSDDYFGGATRTTSRKHDDYERTPLKKPAVPPRDDRERARAMDREKRESERLSRTDKRRTRDQETKRERDRKYTAYDDDSDPDLRHEAERRRRAAEDALREKEARERERAKVERERERERETREDRGRGRDEYERERERGAPVRRGYETATHYSRMEDDAMAYTGRDKRPSLSRSASTATKTETYVDRAGRPTPAFVRRHSNKPAPASPQPRRERDRKMSVPDILETDQRRPASRPPPTLYTSASSPLTNKLPRGVERGPPLRSASMKVEERDVPPMPMPIRRSETMPNISPKRAKDSKASAFRDTDFSGGLPTPSASPDYAPSPTTSYKYHYPRHDASSSREDVDYRRPADRDYDRERRVHHSPEPMRPSKPATAPRYSAAPQPPPIRTNPGYTSTYTTESPTSYSPRPSPVRRDTLRDYEPVAKASVPKANSGAKYEYADYDKERRLDPDAGYSSRRASASAPRPRLHRQHTSEYTYQPRTTVA
ncbi:hypothetical protein AUEXF2481DRAFT_668833 [Aureobasidium subglaciale EXF-2481]|uniref:J domain-containing protein n=1 Tax=Aureobasidium subglaciale (strain EXF-2481) TaxID=1043005 RepID=A0A074ZBW8_AURSE|nr:uncharacterized protein AUEXF2481DRAFT_668833 [Aureobasidium subglaciale EXF-2481]KAI5202756.1 hypothetical protein E4T38_05467 [Aureobasidium subglaciale]KAI5221562.1 hypothetical protein E4T40_05399 [Aureobasidium subglaciale]KAI5225535.1 hypothetical protein E4T41_05219 [Aureobasidium subglaciale]KAI5261486.1 hypothetical protein E4T46_05110 [Aureobasidium subglaciale]KEQ96226.1 hypothetical protein AUEXF2481DRAFT_668833 [Aureobasidium subglaciale EXF-2481]